MPKSLNEKIDYSDAIADWFENAGPEDFTEAPVEEVLRHRAMLVGAAERSLAEAVSDARQRGASWTVIGRALGVSKQAAAGRYREFITHRGEAEKTALRAHATERRPRSQ